MSDNPLMKKNLDYPYWCDEYKSRRHFQAIKRREIDAVLGAIKIARLGSAYFPEYRQFLNAAEEIVKVRKSMRRKVWR
jgi:hypothetical protein